jgi:hypothetical protein
VPEDILEKCYLVTRDGGRLRHPSSPRGVHDRLEMSATSDSFPLPSTSATTIDDMSDPNGSGEASTPLLTFPNPLSFPSNEPSTSTTPSSAPRHVLKDRLYVGNLHPSVDE